MSPFSVENISIDFERNLSMVAKPYPETSKSLHIPLLSTRQTHEWNCLFVLNDYAETQNCRLRIAMPPNETCTFENEIVFYTQNFGVRMLDILSPNILQTYMFSNVKFHQYFVNLPFHTSKTCLTKISPEQILQLIKQRPNLAVSLTKGVILPKKNQTYLDFNISFKSSNISSMLESYFSIGLSLMTWSGDHVAIQISGMCPAANRAKVDLDTMMSNSERNPFEGESGGNTPFSPYDDPYGHQMSKTSSFKTFKDKRDSLSTPDLPDFDRTSMPSSAYTLQTSKRNGEKSKKKYQVRVEIRSSNQEILEILRSDIEGLIVSDLSQGNFIMS